MSNLEDAPSMSSDTSEGQVDDVNEEDPENDTNQQFIGVLRSAWSHSVAFESIKSPSDILNASGKDVFCFQAFLNEAQ